MELGCEDTEPDTEPACEETEPEGERSAQPERTASDEPKQQMMPRPPKGWYFDAEAEYPWQFRQIVMQESNWCASWLLQAKNLRVMEWEKVPCHGSAWDATVLRGHQDDVMAWTSKP
jgi:hypothetical protein